MKKFLELFDGRIFLANEFYRYHLAKIAGAKLQCLVDDAHAALGNLARHFVVQLIEYVFDCCHYDRGKHSTTD